MIIKYLVQDKGFIMKTKSLFIILTFAVVLNIQAQEQSLRGTFAQFKQLGERYKKPESKPITAAINSGSFENIHELVQQVTENIPGNEAEKIRWFVAQLHNEGMITQDLVKKYFEERYVHVVSKAMGITLAAAREKLNELNKQPELLSYPYEEDEKKIEFKVNFSRYIPERTKKIIADVIENDKWAKHRRFTVRQTKSVTIPAAIGVVDNVGQIYLGLTFYLFPEKAQKGVIQHELAHAKLSHEKKALALMTEYKKTELPSSISQLREDEADTHQAVKSVRECKLAESTGMVLKTLSNVQDLWNIFNIYALLTIPLELRKIYARPEIFDIVRVLFIAYSFYDMGKVAKHYMNPTHPSGSKRLETARTLRKLLQEEARLLGETLD